MGAAIASVIAEITILVIQLIYIKNEISILEILKSSIKCIISGSAMFMIVNILTKYMSVSIINTVIEIVIGAIVYILMLIILKYQFLKNLYTQLKENIKLKYKKDEV